MVKSKYLNPCILIMIVFFLAIVVSFIMSVINYNRIDGLVAKQLDQRIPIFDMKLKEMTSLVTKTIEQQNDDISVLRGKISQCEISLEELKNMYSLNDVVIKDE